MNGTENVQRKVLIIEDETSIRQALCDKFRREGFLVFEAKDGEVGLALALLERPNILILDKVMPKMDGVTMLKALRKTDKWSKSVPVILLTNFGSDDEKIMKEITDDMYTHYFVKSNLSLQDVVTHVKDMLQLTSSI